LPCPIIYAIMENIQQKTNKMCEVSVEKQLKQDTEEDWLTSSYIAIFFDTCSY